MRELRIMSVQAHQDDFEFECGGLLALLKERYGNDLKIKILATTRGASGHHKLSLEETFQRRKTEAEKSAALIGAEYECLRCLDGNHLPGQVIIDRNFLGGLWNAVRSFEPDYIFCPPVTTDPLAGIHIDHYNTAWAVRMVAYQLGVPNAYPAMSEILSPRISSPVIINVDDDYGNEKKYDFAVDISGVYETKIKMALCHASQVFEWLPWINGREKVISEEEFKHDFRERHASVNLRFGQDDSVPREYFLITRWGKIADSKDVSIIFIK